MNDQAVEAFLQELMPLCSDQGGELILPNKDVIEDLYKRHPTVKISLRRAAMVVHKRLRQIERNRLSELAKRNQVVYDEARFRRRTRKSSFIDWLKSWFN
jgi:hypothetical protein